MKIHSEVLYSHLLADLQERFPDTDFTSGYEEWPGISGPERQATALQMSILKKFKDQTEAEADARALDKFLQSNIRCRDWSLTWDNSTDEQLLGQFKFELYKFCNPEGYPLVSDADQLWQLGRTGPGSSVGALGTDFYTKMFSSPGACTSERIANLYDHSIRKGSLWSKAESLRLSEYGPPDIVAGSRLSFAVKNATISRVTCTEPLLNMFFQLGLGKLIERRLIQFFGIDVRNQQNKNRELARVASISGRLCTIDLASASDTVSLGMLEAFLPEELLFWLKLFRSPNAELPDGSWEELHMVSSMGNGFTFPLETAIFACVVSAVYRLEGIPLRRTKCVLRQSRLQTLNSLRYGLDFPDDPSQVKWKHGNFGVFGDDIIADSSVNRKIIRLLNLLGFQVNTEKSFFEGPFRESCGADYFDGLPVRGVYIKSLKSMASRYVAINRLNEWSALTGIRLRRTVRYLAKHVRKIYVPLDENDDAGIRVPSTLLRRLECVVEAPGSKPWRPLYGTVRYKAWAPKPLQLRHCDKTCKVRGPGRNRIYNGDGLILAYLRGDIIDGNWSVRANGPTKYHPRWRTSLNWDYAPTAGKQFPVGTMALAKATSLNLF